MARIIKKSATTKPEKTEDLGISVCILSKNDEKLIEECIKSIQPIAKEIIIVDLESTDGTIHIARKYTKRLFRHKFKNNYSAARNVFLKYVSGDWVLWLNAHERLTAESLKLFTPKLLNRRNIGYMVKINEAFHEREVEYYDCRLFKRRSDIKFKRVMHESVTYDVQNLARRDRLEIVPTDIEINKLTYLKYLDESEIHKQNVELAKKGLEIDSEDDTVQTFYKLNLGLSLNSLGERDAAEQELTEVLDQIRSMNRSTVYNIPLFMQAFLFFGFKYSKEEKYEEALKVLKEGAEIYNNSLTMLIRYAELLYMNKMYKDCLDNIAKIRFLLQEETFYQMEPLNLTLIRNLMNLLEEKIYDKYEPFRAKYKKLPASEVLS